MDHYLRNGTPLARGLATGLLMFLHLSVLGAGLLLKFAVFAENSKQGLGGWWTFIALFCHSFLCLIAVMSCKKGLEVKLGLYE